jgi:putative flippase GtrA
MKISRAVYRMFERCRHAEGMGDAPRTNGLAVRPKRWMRYLGAGLVNTVFGYAFYASLLAIGLRPSLAVVLGTIAGALFNFRTIGAVFGSRDAGLLPRFVAVYAAYLVGNLALLHLILAAGVHPLLAQGAAILVLAPCSYLAMQRWVFAGVTG